MNKNKIKASIASVIQQMAAMTSRREELALVNHLLEMSMQFMSLKSIQLHDVRRIDGQYQIRLRAALPYASPQEIIYPSASWQTPPEEIRQLMQEPSMAREAHKTLGHYWHCVCQHAEVVVLLQLDTNDLSEYDRHFLAAIVTLHENYLRLIYDAERDMLTGLRNRRTFDARLFELLELRRGQETLALIDIDHFKRVNDQYGHIMGDEVLLLLARKIESCLGEHARIYRYGGEEFAIILPNQPENAYAILDELRQEIALMRIPQVGHISISVGYVTIGQQNLPANLIEEADKALYFAKEHGRNQVYGYQALIDKGLVQDKKQQHGDIELF